MERKRMESRIRWNVCQVVALGLCAGALIAATPGAARAGDEFENGFKSELGRIAAHTVVRAGHAIAHDVYASHERRGHLHERSFRRRHDDRDRGYRDHRYHDTQHAKRVTRKTHHRSHHVSYDRYRHGHWHDPRTHRGHVHRYGRILWKPGYGHWGHGHRHGRGGSCRY